MPFLSELSGFWLDLVFFGWKGMEKRGRSGLVTIFLYNVIPLFFTLLRLSALIFKVALIIFVGSGMFSFSTVILGIVAFFFQPFSLDVKR